MSNYTVEDTTASGLLSAAGDTVYCEYDDEAKTEADALPPLVLQWDKSGSKLVVVCGENASGKSFLRRIVQTICADAKVECIALSVEGRRTVSYNPWLAMVYGDESTHSTGANSGYIVRASIRTSLERTNPHVIFLDEPDLGLSDGWAACAGRTLAEFVRKENPTLQACFVVSHSKALIAELAAVNPQFVYVGDDRKIESLSAWLEAPTPRYESLEDLATLGTNRFRRISRRRKSLNT